MSGIWRLPAPLLLASTSATRRLLLESAGLPVEAEAPGVDERALDGEGGADPVALARRLAEAKALAVSGRRPGRLVLGADQTLDLAGHLFHKPSGRDEAREQILALAGRTHRLASAAALARDGAVLDLVHEAADLTLRPLDGAGVDRYLALAGEAVTRSVGGYQLEGLGIHLFERIEGDHATILGLPMLSLLRSLRRLGALAL